MITTDNYMVNVEIISQDVFKVYLYDKFGKLLLKEKLPSKTLYDVAICLYYLIEENISCEFKFPMNNIKYVYILYCGKSHYGEYHLILIKQNIINEEDETTVANEYLEYYQIKNIISDIQNIYQGV